MANPNPNSFVSPYKIFHVQKDTTDPDKWIVRTRVSKYHRGEIYILDKQWQFVAGIVNYTHLELLDIAACIKIIEKRADTPALYKG